MSTHHGRMKFLIFPRFQLSIIAVNLGIIFTMALILWVVAERIIADMQPAAGLSANELQVFEKYVAYQASQVRTALLVALLLGSSLSVVITLWVSHRFAGPLVRLRNYFRAVSGGARPIPELRFRDGDYLSDLPPLINKALQEAQADARKPDRSIA